MNQMNSFVQYIMKNKRLPTESNELIEFIWLIHREKYKNHKIN